MNFFNLRNLEQSNKLLGRAWINFWDRAVQGVAYDGIDKGEVFEALRDLNAKSGHWLEAIKTEAELVEEMIMEEEGVAW